MTNFETFNEGLRIVSEISEYVNELKEGSEEREKLSSILTNKTSYGAEYDFVGYEVDEILEHYMDNDNVPTYELIISIHNNWEAFDKVGLSEDDKKVIFDFADILWNQKSEENHGGEGEGESYYSVWYFPSVGMYIRFDGFYQSYHGSEFRKHYEVTPKQKTITVYE